MEDAQAEITIAKFQNRVHVYGVEGGFAMFFDIDGRGTDIFPTVYALWKVLELLPAFMLKGGEVSRYVIGGADLMFPGISIPAEGLLSFLAGPWAVKVQYLGIFPQLQESAEGHYVPNAGLEDVVFEDSSLSSSCQASDFSEGFSINCFR